MQIILQQIARFDTLLVQICENLAGNLLIYYLCTYGISS